MWGSKLHIYARLMAAIVAAILVSNLLVQDVFIGATPNVRTDFADRLVERSLAFINIDNYIAFFGGNRGSVDPDIAKVPYTPTLVRGVYAKETARTHLTEVRYDEVQWVEVPYVRKSGKTEMIKIPAGTTPPAPGLF